MRIVDPTGLVSPVSLTRESDGSLISTREVIRRTDPDLVGFPLDPRTNDERFGHRTFADAGERASFFAEYRRLSTVGNRRYPFVFARKDRDFN